MDHPEFFSVLCHDLDIAYSLFNHCLTIWGDNPTKSHIIKFPIYFHLTCKMIKLIWIEQSLYLEKATGKKCCMVSASGIEFRIRSSGSECYFSSEESVPQSRFTFFSLPMFLQLYNNNNKKRLFAI